MRDVAKVTASLAKIERSQHDALDRESGQDDGETHRRHQQIADKQYGDLSHVARIPPSTLVAGDDVRRRRRPAGCKSPTAR